MSAVTADMSQPVAFVPAMVPPPPPGMPKTVQSGWGPPVSAPGSGDGGVLAHRAAAAFGNDPRVVPAPPPPHPPEGEEEDSLLDGLMQEAF